MFLINTGNSDKKDGMIPIITNGNGHNEDPNSAEGEYFNKSKPFVYNSTEVTDQYCYMYRYRLTKMTKLLEEKVRTKWGNDIPIKKLFQLREDCPDKCIIIGTLFKHQKHKPSILREISESNQLNPQPQKFLYADDDDKLILEDELQRIDLKGVLDVHSLATGVCCAVVGYQESGGVFLVEDIIFYESGPQKSLIKWVTSPLLVLISGLDMIQLNEPGGTYRQSVETLKNWLSGNIHLHGDKKKVNSMHVVRVVIAGNSIRSKPDVKKRNLLVRMPEYPDTVQSVKYLDQWCADSCRDTDIDVMSGEFDPTNFVLPQQPLHNCLFSLANKFDTFKSVTNPYSFEFGDRVILGTSGQNIQDILRSTKIKDPLEVLRLTIRWSHIAPTCPDTLACYPYMGKDPFIVSECPHIYFAGNLDKFQTDLYEGADGKKIRLVCVPSFSKTQSVAVIDLGTLDSYQLSFKM